MVAFRQQPHGPQPGVGLEPQGTAPAYPPATQGDQLGPGIRSVELGGEGWGNRPYLAPWRLWWVTEGQTATMNTVSSYITIHPSFDIF